jgi:hypothetical protein
MQCITVFPCAELYVVLQVSDALLSLLLADEREALKITSTGLKLFERQEMKGKQTSKCNYRIAQVGCATMQYACLCVCFSVGSPDSLSGWHG